jgi:hypothetical protein
MRKVELYKEFCKAWHEQPVLKTKPRPSHDSVERAWDALLAELEQVPP